MISVIVPVYNASKYLRQCVDSIINQTYKNLEIIFVDDGSTDDSGAICDEYAKQDSRVKVIHKQNGGVSSARNEGLKIATSEYIGFVDSDDLVHKDFFLCLYNSIQDSDISICNFRCFTANDTDWDQHSIVCANSISLDRTQLFTSLLTDTRICGYLWNKLFKRKLIKDMLDETLHYAEDFLFCAKYSQNVNKVNFVDEKLYLYRKDSDTSITKNFLNYNNKVFSLLRAQLKTMDIYIAEAPSLSGLFSKIILDTALDMLGRYKYNKIDNKDQYGFIKKTIAKYYPIVTKTINIKQRIRYFFRKNTPLMYFKHKYRFVLR